MKTKLVFFAIALAAPLLSQPMFATITYEYTGNPFTEVSGSYTTSDFVTATVTFANPLAPNMPLTQVFPTAFSLSDGVQTITNLTAGVGLGPGSGPPFFFFGTGPTGTITVWLMRVFEDTSPAHIEIDNSPPFVMDIAALSENDFGNVLNAPGTWVTGGSVPDAGSTLSLMTLTLVALGLVAPRFRRAAA